MPFRFSLKVALLFALGAIGLTVFAQQQGTTIRGVVADQDSAVIPGATVTLILASGKALTTQSQADGSYVIKNVTPGTYSITVTMSGFATFVKQGLKITSGQALTLDARMAIQEQDQEVQVTAQTNTLSVDQDSNASSTTIKGSDLDALSDDPDELSSELTALAGPAAGPSGGQIYVDGFTGGQLPPKSSIREIRINQNPFSAQFDKLGYGRVEVFTKPGTDKLHGSAQLNGNDSSFNTGNPLLNLTHTQQPPYHTILFLGNMTGPIASFASFSVGGSYRNIQDNAIVNGTVLAPPGAPANICQPGDATCVHSSYQAAVPIPQSRYDISPRFDFALGEKNTLTIRYQYEQNSHTNNGVGSFVTASAGNNTTTAENTLQMSDTQIVNSHVINETRFEFQRDTSSQIAFSTAPNLAVQGNFTTGGSSSGSSQDNQNHYELQNYTSVQLKKNFIRAGGRLRITTDSNTTTAGTNGSFTYADLVAYQANTPSQFTITKINSGTSTTSVDLGLYAEDDWKPRPNLTLSYGFRYEVQNFLSEHHDFAPRLSFAYGLGNTKETPKTVLRGGFGIFYDRFMLTNQITTDQQNGINEIQSTAVFNTPPALICSPTTVNNCLASVAALGNTTYTGAPNLRSPYTLQFEIGADRQLFKGATVSVNYLRARGVHQFISQNVNAPLTPTGPGADGTGAVRYQFQSEAVFRENQVLINFNLRNSKRYSLFGYYALNFAKSDTAGATSFPSVPYNIGADYGRATFDTRSRLFLGGSIYAKYHVTLSPFILAFSGTPYNITTGSDVNGDSIFNDRPAFANGHSARCTVLNDFVIPAHGAVYTPIPINYCTGPALFSTNLRVSKTFGFGASIEPVGAQGGPGGPAGHGPGGHGGRGGFGGGASTGKRYNLAFGAQIQNLFNYKDLGAPIGNLASKELFGKSNQLAGNPFTSNAAVQRIQVYASFTF